MPNQKPFAGPERRQELHISEEQIQAIAEKAAALAVKKLTEDTYKAIGKGVLEKLFWIVGVCSAAAYFWLNAKGLVK